MVTHCNGRFIQLIPIWVLLFYNFHVWDRPTSSRAGIHLIPGHPTTIYLINPQIYRSDC